MNVQGISKLDPSIPFSPLEALSLMPVFVHAHMSGGKNGAIKKALEFQECNMWKMKELIQFMVVSDDTDWMMLYLLSNLIHVVKIENHNVNVILEISDSITRFILEKDHQEFDKELHLIKKKHEHGININQIIVAFAHSLMLNVLSQAHLKKMDFDGVKTIFDHLKKLYLLDMSDVHWNDFVEFFLTTTICEWSLEQINSSNPVIDEKKGENETKSTEFMRLKEFYQTIKMLVSTQETSPPTVVPQVVTSESDSLVGMPRPVLVDLDQVNSTNKKVAPPVTPGSSQVTGQVTPVSQRWKTISTPKQNLQNGQNQQSLMEELKIFASGGNKLRKSMSAPKDPTPAKPNVLTELLSKVKRIEPCEPRDPKEQVEKKKKVENE